MCLIWVLVACSKSEKDTGDSKSNFTESVIITPEDVTKVLESDHIDTEISEPEPTAIYIPTGTPEPTVVPTDIPTATPIPEPTEVPIWSTSNGDIITFGSYEQDNELSNGKEPIEWIVLSNDGEKLLLLSKYALDCQPYNTEQTEITWENCTLRVWLNSDFYNRAFSDTEKAVILKSYIENNDNPSFGTEGGNDTYDNVFLLSLSDMINTRYGFSSDYLDYDIVRRCEPSAYTIAQGAWQYSGDKKDGYTADGRGACWWWLRSPGDDMYHAGSVGYHGRVRDDGLSADNRYLLNVDDCICLCKSAVRPAIVISIQ